MVSTLDELLHAVVRMLPDEATIDIDPGTKDVVILTALTKVIAKGEAVFMPMTKWRTFIGIDDPDELRRVPGAVSYDRLAAWAAALSPSAEILAPTSPDADAETVIRLGLTCSDGGVLVPTARRSRV